MQAYNKKHNEANGESNNDGENHNISWNCGTEGDVAADWKVKVCEACGPVSQGEVNAALQLLSVLAALSWA